MKNFKFHFLTFFISVLLTSMVGWVVASLAIIFSILFFHLVSNRFIYLASDGTSENKKEKKEYGKYCLEQIASIALGAVIAYLVIFLHEYFLIV